MLITELRPGVRATVEKIDASPEDEKRLREHGLDEGVEIELLHKAAFGADPVAVRIGNACVAMRRAMAASVLVAPVESPAAGASLQAAE